MDLAEAHISALDHVLTMSGSDVFNVGTGSGYTVKEVFQTAQEVTGLEIPFEITDRREGDSEKLVADPTKIEAVLGWKAEHDLHDIIQSAWDFERQR